MSVLFYNKTMKRELQYDDRQQTKYGEFFQIFESNEMRITEGEEKIDVCESNEDRRTRGV